MMPGYSISRSGESPLSHAGLACRAVELPQNHSRQFGPNCLNCALPGTTAARYYAEGLRLIPALSQTHYYLGLEWMKRGAFEQAAASFGEAVRLTPGWADARAQQQRALSRSQETTHEHRAPTLHSKPE